MGCRCNRNCKRYVMRVENAANHHFHTMIASSTWCKTIIFICLSELKWPYAHIVPSKALMVNRDKILMISGLKIIHFLHHKQIKCTHLCKNGASPCKEWVLFIYFVQRIMFYWSWYHREDVKRLTFCVRREKPYKCNICYIFCQAEMPHVSF